MTATQNRREGARVLANFECRCASTRQKGTGVVFDISYSGALLEEASLVPSRGEQIELSVELSPTVSFVLIGWVVRHTQRGFAIEYDEPDAAIRRLVDDVGAIVNVSRRRRAPRD